MSAPGPRRLPPEARHRVLALMGITRWQRRTREAPAAAQAPATAIDARVPVAARTAAGSPPRVQPPVLAVGAPRAPATRRRLVLQLGEDAGAAPLAGPYRALLLHLLRAVDVLPPDARINPPAADGLPELVLGGVPSDAAAVLGPPLAVLRADPRARRNLWPLLRRLSRGLPR